MPIKHGSTGVGAVYYGSTAIGRVYHGPTLVFDGAGGGATPWSATLTVPSGKTGSDLSSFPLYVDLSEMPASFWANTNAGKDMRASVGGSQVACDLVWIDTANETGTAFVLVPTLAAASSTVVTLSGNGLDDLPAVSDTYARNAVWADYEAVFLLGETGPEDRTGGAFAYTDGDPDYFEKIDDSGATDTNSHQGVDYDGTYYYTTDTNAIYKWDASWTLVDSNANPIGDAAISGTPTVDSLGDVLCHDGKLYIPIEKYPASGGLYNAHIAVFDASDLSFITAYDISAQGHEAASIAYCDRDGYLYVVDRDGNDDQVYKYTTTGTYIGALTCNLDIAERRGITWWRERFWVSQDANDETIMVLYDGTVTPGNTATGVGGIGFGGGASGGYGGIGFREDALLQLRDNGTTETVEAWQPKTAALMAGGGYTKAQTGGEGVHRGGMASYSTFTMAVTMIHSTITGNENQVGLGYIDVSATAASNTRVGLANRVNQSPDTIGVWDPANSWLSPASAITPVVGTAYRLHGVYNGTTSRALYHNGSQVASQSGISAAPSALDGLNIGFDDGSFAERFSGTLGFVYLRPSVLSADWIAAEYSMINAPASFYTIT